MPRSYRTFTDKSGTQWEVSEVLRYGIGRRPVTADTAVVVFQSGSGERHEALLQTGEIMKLNSAELSQLVEEVVAFDKANRP